jgi:16S rRNA C1402 (ribose-2'-O) methylase RsmI
MSDNRSVFRENVVFGTSPIGCPSDMTFRLAEHIKSAQIILIESHREFSRLLTDTFNDSITKIYDIQTFATIYQYDLHSDDNQIDEINRILLEESKHKRILVLSDEGSSIFLEPASQFKHLLRENNIPFQYIPGPNSVITAVCLSNKIYSDFYFGGSLPPIEGEDRNRLFTMIKNSNLPTVFLLTAVDARSCVQDIKNFFGNDWDGEFLINLTMDTEKIITGTFDDILKYIDENSEYFEKDMPHKKFAMNLLPLRLDRYIRKSYYDDKKR